MCQDLLSYPTQFIQSRKPCEKLITIYRDVKEPGSSPLIVWPNRALLLHGDFEIVLIFTARSTDTVPWTGLPYSTRSWEYEATAEPCEDVT
jgi:hypothetical protein